MFSAEQAGQLLKGEMALTQRLEIRQSHALVMTPQLMQAIKLLQLSSLDLAGYVEGELERNPLLERVGESDGEEERRGADLEDSPDTAASLPASGKQPTAICRSRSLTTSNCRCDWGQRR